MTTAFRRIFSLIKKENSIKVTLPITDYKPILTIDESKIIDYLKKGFQASSNDLVVVTGFSKNKVLRIIKSLQQKEYIKISGIGKGTKYSL